MTLKKGLLPMMLACFFIMPNQSIGQDDLVMDATWEDGTVNSGDPEIEAEPPLEERLFVDSDIARNSDFSLVHQGPDTIEIIGIAA